MPALKQFFLRGSALMIGLLFLWWFVLLNPMLYLIREAAAVCGSVAFGVSARWISEAASGDWTVEVPLEATLPSPSGQPGGGTHVTSISFDLARSDAGAFTFGLPVYWAIILAAPGIRRSLRPLVLGTAVMTLAEVVLLLIFVEIFARQTAAHWSQTPSPITDWALRFGNYLTVNVVPYIAPFLVAIGMHNELRRQLFSWGGEPAALGNTAKAVPKSVPRSKRRVNV